MTNDIRLYKALRTKLGETETEELVSFVKSEIQNGFMDNKDIFLIKQDKVEIIQEMKSDKEHLITALKSDKEQLIITLKSDKEQLLKEMKTDKEQLIREMKSDKEQLIKEMSKMKSDILKAIFLTGLIQYLTITASVLALVKLIFDR